MSQPRGRAVLGEAEAAEGLDEEEGKAGDVGFEHVRAILAMPSNFPIETPCLSNSWSSSKASLYQLQPPLEEAQTGREARPRSMFKL